MSSSVVYTCSRCDAQSPKWSGRCLACGAWGSISNIPEEKNSNAAEQQKRKTSAGQPVPFSNQSFTPAHFQALGLPMIDRILSGGLVDGSVSLLAGEPGAGKSTLVAQMALAYAKQGKNIMYVTGEESPAQIFRRLSRLEETVPPSLHFLDLTQAETIAATIEDKQPDLTIIDSIQSLQSQDVNGEAGGINQVKASAARITEAAKRTGKPAVLVGQVTKDGDMAGPRLLEHLVDTVLFLEGDHLHRYRMLRVIKHRFGPTDDVALFAMTERGLMPVEDASAELLRDRPVGVPGSCVTCLLEGHRPLLLEIQALVSPAGYGTPIRRASGVDGTRLGMLLAVLARRAGIHAIDKDVYANAAGGIDARDPSVDLAIATAITSAIKDTTLDPRLAMFGEIGLAGELRPVSLADQRIKEIARLGFTQVIVPKHQGKSAPKDMIVHEAATLREAFQMMHLI